MTNSNVVRNVQEALRRHFAQEHVPEYIATAIAKVALETFESTSGEIRSVPREIYERDNGYIEVLKERMAIDALIAAFKLGYLPAALPKLEERRIGFMQINASSQALWPEDGEGWPEDSNWDVMVIKLTLPLRRADLDSQYTLQPNPKG